MTSSGAYGGSSSSYGGMEDANSPANRAATASPSYSMRAAGWETYQATPSTYDRQPSFAAASSSGLPGALGINSSAHVRSTLRDAPPQYSTSANQSGSSYSRNDRTNSRSSLPQSSYPNSLASFESAGANSKPSKAVGGGAEHALRGGDGESHSRDPRKLRQRRPGTAGEPIGNGAGNGSSDSSSNMRNFLVPISGTGARQKLSILSASQRPRTASAAPSSSFGSGGGGGASLSGHFDTHQSISTSSTSSLSLPYDERRTKKVGAPATDGDRGPEVPAQERLYHERTPSSSTADRRLLMQRSDSDLGSQTARLNRFLPHEPGTDHVPGRGDDYRASNRAPSSSSMQRPLRSNSASGSGFSPQLASVLSGQSSGIPVNMSSAENTTPSYPQQLQQQHTAGYYDHSSPSLSELQASAGPRDNMQLNPASLAKVEQILGARSVSQPSQASHNLNNESSKRSVSARRDASQQKGFAGADGSRFDSLERPSSAASSSAKDKPSAFKGLRNMFGRGSKGSSRPSTASSIGSANNSAPQFHQGSHAPYDTVASQQFGSSGRQHEQQQFRSPSSMSQRSISDSIMQSNAESRQYGHEAQLPSMSSTSSWTSSSMRTRLSEDSNSDVLTADGAGSSNGSVRTVGRKSSNKDLAPSTSTLVPLSASTLARSFTEGSFKSDYSQDENKDDDDRAKTPVPYHRSTASSHSDSRLSSGNLTSNEAEQVSRTTSNYLGHQPSKQQTQSTAALDSYGHDNLVDRRTTGSTSSLNTATSRDTLSPATKTTRRPEIYTLPTNGSGSESTYSAPNSSRSLSPSDLGTPSVPLTSPLFSSVLSQQMAQQNLVPVSPQPGDQKAKKQEQSQSPERPPEISKRSSGSDLQTSPNGGQATNTDANRKPFLPSKSRHRSTSVSGTSFTAESFTSSENDGRENSAGKANESPSSNGKVGKSARAKVVEAKADRQRDPQTYVPPDALKRTRKGIPVRSQSASQSAIAVESDPSEQALAKLEGRTVPPTALSKRPSATEVAAKEVPPSKTGFDAFEGHEEDGDNSVDVVTLLPNSAWEEVHTALQRFRMIPSQGSNDKGTLLRTVLLPFLALEAETPETQVSGVGMFSEGKSRRNIFFEWIRQLLLELQSIQTSADRGAILESIACIMESRNLSAHVIESDKDDGQSFFEVLGHILNYAIGELNKKGVYQNTLIFSGRLLAVAFFRIEGVASKLLRALPVNRFALERVANEANWQDTQPSDWNVFKQHFPIWLRSFCFEDARSYLKMLDSQSGQTEDDDHFLVRQGSIEVEMSGNWLRRWQSDDSELFFSFCRNYHRQLASVFLSQQTSKNAATSKSQKCFFGGPGYAHLATCIHQKCLSLVHRDILSVTTLSSQKNFNPGETANVLSGSTAGKPRHLEAANRRCTAIVVDIVRSAPSSSEQPSIFEAMLGIHIKCLVKRTSLYDVQGVFCLLDWLDGVLLHVENSDMVVSNYVDVDFLLQTIWLLLKDADHALALMRTIAFCYSNFAILTGTLRHRERFFEEILLHPAIFQKLFLSWSFTIRAYFLHLLVFRLARINDFANPEDDPNGKTSLRVVKLFNKRLDEIRKRHDELSPQPSSTDSQSDDDDGPGGKQRPQSFVSTIRHTPSVHALDLSPAMTKAERVLGIGMPDPVLSNKGENKAQSRAAKWLRALGGKGSNGKNKGSSGWNGPGPSPSDAMAPKGRFPADEVPKILNEPRTRMPRLDEMDIFSDEDEDDLSSSNAGRQSDEDAQTPRSESDFEFSFEQHRPNGNQPNGDRNSEDPTGSSQSNDDAGQHSDSSNALGENISSEMSFDLQNSLTTPFTPEAGAPQQQRISRAFSRRRSLLPGHALSLVHGEESERDSEQDADNDGKSIAGSSYDGEEHDYDRHAIDAADDEAALLSQDGHARDGKKRGDREDGSTNKAKSAEKDAGIAYSRHLHIYAVQSLREYEQTVQEHDDFFNSQQDAEVPQVPRLPIQWPAMWSE